MSTQWLRHKSYQVEHQPTNWFCNLQPAWLYLLKTGGSLFAVKMPLPFFLSYANGPPGCKGCVMSCWLGPLYSQIYQLSAVATVTLVTKNPQSDNTPTKCLFTLLRIENHNLITQIERQSSWDPRVCLPETTIQQDVDMNWPFKPLCSEFNGISFLG